MKKKLSILLAVILVLTLVPTVALAADATFSVGAGEMYGTIQEAVNDAGDGTTTIIVKAGVYGEEVDILQQEGKNIILEGETGTVLTGAIIIDGNGRSAGAETVTIRSIDFDRSGMGAPTTPIIDMKKIGATTYSYTHNVTIEDCSFVGDPTKATVAIQAGSSGGNNAYNTVVRNCSFRQLHSMMQARCSGITIENVIATDLSEGGINSQNSKDITITDSKIDASNYGLRAGQSTGDDDSGFVRISNCLISTPFGADGSVFLRGAFHGEVTVESSDILGDINNGSVHPIIFSMNDTYFNGTASGFDPGELIISNSAASPHFQSTQVKAAAEPTYMIMIPAVVDFGTLQKDSGTKSKAFAVSATNVVIGTGSSIDVGVISPFEMKDQDGSGTNSLAYTLFNGSGQVSSGANYASFTQNGSENGSVKVDTSAITTAGSYSGTMDFTISYQD